jgi:integrase/recombinase XerD
MIVIKLFWKWLEKENVGVENVSYNDLLLYVKYRSKKGASQRTIQHYMGTIKHFYDYLISEEKISNNPTINIEIKGIKRKSLYYILEPHELQALHNQYADKAYQDKRNKVMLGLLINQGLKTEELGKLEVKDINLREGKIEVPGGKRSNGRTMTLEAHQVMEMYDYVLKVRLEILEINPKRKSQIKVETDKLFIGEGGSSSSFSNMMTRIMIRIRKLNPNVLNAKQIRASVITKWLKVYNLREVQVLAGHRYISSTEQYLQNDMEGLQEEVEKYHPLG